MTPETFVADLNNTAAQLAGLSDANLQGSLLGYGQGSAG
jgi:hypothetical protein